MTAISIEITEKRYRSNDAELTAIAGLTFDVADREFVCVLGPSGCGKTTMLNLIAGIDTHFTGRISMASDARDHLAYVFQTPRLLPWRTAAQNIQLVISGNAATGAAADPLASNLLDAVGMTRFADHYPGELSLGMQRRVSLARAFARQPSLMLMDEPFVSLDPDSAMELRDLLRSILAARPATVIFVTHDHREAVQLGDRVVMLSGSPSRVAGEVEVTLSPAERSSRAQVDRFIEQKLK